jgi:hypothetical protein
LLPKEFPLQALPEPVSKRFYFGIIIALTLYDVFNLYIKRRTTKRFARIFLGLEKDGNNEKGNEHLAICIFGSRISCGGDEHIVRSTFR